MRKMTTQASFWEGVGRLVGRLLGALERLLSASWASALEVSPLILGVVVWESTGQAGRKQRQSKGKTKKKQRETKGKAKGKQ